MRWLRLAPLLLVAAPSVSATRSEHAASSESAVDIPVRPLDPRAFTKKFATCKALNRKTNEEKEIQISYVDINPGAERTLVMVHGWPAIWHSWKYQIEEFKDDYHIIALDQRGFGESTHPGDVESSGQMSDLVSDIVCVMDHAGVKKAGCVGHDWGTQVCYESTRMRPDRFDVVVGTCIPYLHYYGPFVPVAHLVPTLPKLAYNIFFEKNTTEAAKELNSDIRRSLRAIVRSRASGIPHNFLEQTDSIMYGWQDTEIPPIPFLTPEEEDYWMEQFAIQGFDNSLNFYTYGNKYASWQLAQTQGNFTIPMPTLSILPTDDPVADWQLASKLLQSHKFVPHLRTATVEAAHWLQLEKPDEVNAIMRRWLDRWYPPTGPLMATTPDATSEPVETGTSVPAVEPPQHTGHDEL